jgi:hypothetical protein
MVVVVKFIGLSPWESGLQFPEFLTSDGLLFELYREADLTTVSWNDPGELAFSFVACGRDKNGRESTALKDIPVVLTFRGVRNLQISQDPKYDPSAFDEISWDFECLLQPDGLGRVSGLVAAGLDLNFTCTEVQFRVDSANRP